MGTFSVLLEEILFSIAEYSAYDRELTAIYEAVKYFSLLVEGRDFKTSTDHKPLIYALMQKVDKASLGQTRQLSLIAQYTTQIKYIQGADNTVANSLSRVVSIKLPLEIDLNDLAVKREADEQMKAIRESPDYPLSLKRTQCDPAHTTIYCEITGKAIRPYIPESFRESVFNLFHKPAHPAPRSPIDSSGNVTYGLTFIVIF